MESERGYQGFLNYETWAVALWLNNDEGSYLYWNDAAQEELENSEECFDEQNNPCNDLDEATHKLSLRIQEEVTEGMPDLGSSVYADLLNAAFSKVDWQEVARDFLEDVDR